MRRYDLEWSLNGTVERVAERLAAAVRERSNCCGPRRCLPRRTSDAELPAGPSPGQAANLPQGVLVATRTGLPAPADGELLIVRSVDAMTSNY